MKVPASYEDTSFGGVLDNPFKFAICRDGNIPQAQVDQEYPVLASMGMKPEYEKCTTRGYAMVVKANTGDGGNFYSAVVSKQIKPHF